MIKDEFDFQEKIQWSNKRFVHRFKSTEIDFVINYDLVLKLSKEDKE